MADLEPVLVDLYSAYHTSVDRLAQSPATLADFTADVNSRIGATFRPEQILAQLLRLRKTSRLPRLFRKVVQL